MKTSIYDHPRNVFELQTSLRDLRRTNSSMPLINPDGVFGSETTGAVISAQTFFGLPRTGIVDYETWRLLFQNYGI